MSVMRNTTGNWSVVGKAVIFAAEMLRIKTGRVQHQRVGNKLSDDKDEVVLDTNIKELQILTC